MVKNMNNIKIIHLSAITFSIIAVISCGSARSKFEMVQAYMYLKPGTIAVIAGTSKDQDYLLAKSITDNLQKETDLTVMSQEEIAGKIPDYPFKNIITEQGGLKGAFTPDGKFRIYWLSPENMNTVNSLQEKLKTEYIYIVWTGSMYVVPDRPMCVVGSCVMDTIFFIGALLGGGGGGGGIMEGETHISAIAINGRLLSYPAGEVTGYTIDNFSRNSCCLIMPFSNDNREITYLLQDTGREIALGISKFTQKKKRGPVK